MLSTYNVIWRSYYEEKSGYELLAHPDMHLFVLWTVRNIMTDRESIAVQYSSNEDVMKQNENLFGHQNVISRYSWYNMASVQ